jgi:hypothetical protein
MEEDSYPHQRICHPRSGREQWFVSYYYCSHSKADCVVPCDGRSVVHTFDSCGTLCIVMGCFASGVRNPMDWLV